MYAWPTGLNTALDMTNNDLRKEESSCSAPLLEEKASLKWTIGCLERQGKPSIFRLAQLSFKRAIMCSHVAPLSSPANLTASPFHSMCVGRGGLKRGEKEERKRIWRLSKIVPLNNSIDTVRRVWLALARGEVREGRNVGCRWKQERRLGCVITLHTSARWYNKPDPKGRRRETREKHAKTSLTLWRLCVSVSVSVSVFLSLSTETSSYNFFSLSLVGTTNTTPPKPCAIIWLGTGVNIYLFIHTTLLTRPP